MTKQYEIDTLAGECFWCTEDVFFATHDPTTVNRQGNDVGQQCRSAVFCHDEQQRKITEQIMAQLAKEKIFDSPIVTQIVPSTDFFPAGGYHPDYYANNPAQPYCQTIISPKIAKLRQKFPSYLK